MRLEIFDGNWPDLTNRLFEARTILWNFISRIITLDSGALLQISKTGLDKLVLHAFDRCR